MNMTTEDFWNKYVNEDILEIFDLTYDFFSKELPKEFIENYDVAEVMLETKGHHETAKEFEKVLKFIKLLQEKQPELYKENFQYFDDFLIDYYCFHKDSSKVEKSFSNFMLKPTQDFDMYLISFRKLLFCGYIDILNNAITKNFNEVNTSDKLIGSAGYDLAISKFYITIEEYYKKSDNAVFNKEMFLKTLKEYGFDYDEDLLSAINKGIYEQISKEEIASAFFNDRLNFIITLEMYFLRYMKERNFSFALSGRFWDKILEFWSEGNKQKRCKPDKYFRVNSKELEKYISNLSGDMFIDNKSEMIAVLWGSIYIYDFLKSIEIISQETFDNFLEASKILKGKVIGQYTSDLWNSNFVHSWEKPDSISAIEFIEEEIIFKKSIRFKHQKFTRLRSEINDELAKIGELSTYIIEGGKNDENKYDTSVLDDYFDFNNEVEDEDNSMVFDENRIIEPVRVEIKVGRNEPCPCGSGKKYKKCCGNK